MARKPLVGIEQLEDRSTPAVAFALSGANLLSFDTDNPTVTQSIAITGVAAGETLAGIDFRPQNGYLYGLGVNAGADTMSVYNISVRTGLATVVGTGNFVGAGNLPDPATTPYGFDFNPTIDQIRVTTRDSGAGVGVPGLNFRLNPSTGTFLGSNTDINPGGTSIDEVAYTNNAQNATATTLYTLSATSDMLFIQNPAGSGTQTLGIGVTLGGNPLDITTVTGFDIPNGVNVATSNSPVTSGSALAILNVGGSNGLYSINLVDATATLIENDDAGATAIQGFSIQNDYVGFPSVALGVAGDSLVRFNTATPGESKTVAVTGLVVGETLVGVDTRPQTGQLFGLGFNPANGTGSATIYVLDPQTGTATVVGAAGSVADGAGTPVSLAGATSFGFDFNPTVDRIRIVTDNGLNLRVNPNNGAVAGNVLDGGINGSGVTGVTGTAYTNSFGQSLMGGVTTLYTIDGTTDSLYIQNPPNDGVQTNPLPITVGGSPLDFSDVVGFDIPSGVRVATSTSPAIGFGYASLVVSGTTNLYRIDLSSGEASLLGAAPAAVSGLALGDQPDSKVSFDSATVAANESSAMATLTFNRTGSTAGAVTVPVTLSAGTAAAGADFDDTTILVTFADGQTTATASVPIVDEAIFESDETFTATLGTPSIGAIGAIGSTTVTIANDDTAPVFSIDSVSGPEGNLTFTVTLTGATELPATVAVDSKDGTALSGVDYSAVTGLVLTFAPGVTTQTVTVDVDGDDVFEADETFTLELSAPTNATVDTGTGTGTIVNDDAAPVFTIGDLAISEGNAGTSTLTFTVTLTGATELPATVTVATVDNTALAGSDYAALAGQTLTFNAGDTTKSVTVTVNGDTDVENDETFSVSLSGATNATVGTAKGTGTILNDDAAPPQNPLIVGTPRSAIGTDGLPPSVRVVDANGKQVSATALTAAFNGGVRTASGDVDGDGIEDVVVGSGPGGPSLVRVLSGKDGTELLSVAPFEASFIGGVFVSAGDLNGDGRADIVITPDAGGGPRVKIFDGVKLAQIADFFGIDDPNFRGGARTAIGDVNGDGTGDLVVAAGLGGGPRVSAIDGSTITTTRSTLFNDFFAFEESVRDGVFVAVGDFDGDGLADIVATGGPGGGPRILIVDAQTLITSKGATLTPLANFFAGDPNARSGVRVAVKDLDGDNLADLRTAIGGSDAIRSYLGKNLSPTETDPQFIGMDGLPNFNGGVFVG